MDNIPAELLKQGCYLCTRALHRHITKVWADENIPQQWRDAKIVTIYKNKGDKTIGGNHRGISLLAVAGKVLAKVLLQRLLNNITESLLPESQCGFRKNRSTVDMVFTARQLQEKCRDVRRIVYKLSCSECAADAKCDRLTPKVSLAPFTQQDALQKSCKQVSPFNWTLTEL